MYQIILISHNGLAKAMAETAAMICGQHDNIETYGLALGADVEAFRARVTEAIEKNLQKGDVLVLSDIQSGSPFNVAIGAMTKFHFGHFTGMNLPIVIEAIMCSSMMSVDEVMEHLDSLKSSAVVNVNKLFDSNLKEEEED